MDMKLTEQTKPRWNFIKRYLQSSSNIWAENNILKLMLLVLTLALLLDLTIGMVDRNVQRTVVVPFGAGGDLYVTGSKPSESYMKAMIRNLVTLSGTFTASSIATQYEEILSLVHPSKYGQMRDDFRGIISEVQRYPGVSFAMYVRGELPIQRFSDHVVVPVLRMRFLGGTVRRETGNLTIAFVVEDARWWLTNLSFEADKTQAGGSDQNLH